MIDVQPSDASVESGGAATFTVAASGEGLSYQWYGPDGGLLEDSDGEIEGSTSSTLQIMNATSDDAGDYTVVVTNSAGSVTSDAATLSIGELFGVHACSLRVYLCMCTIYERLCRLQVRPP